MNRRIRNRMYGGVGGRRAQALLLPDNKTAKPVWRCEYDLPEVPFGTIRGAY